MLVLDQCLILKKSYSSFLIEIALKVVHQQKSLEKKKEVFHVYAVYSIYLDNEELSNSYAGDISAAKC